MAQDIKVTFRKQINRLRRPIYSEVSHANLKLIDLFLLTSLLGLFASGFITSYFPLDLTSSLSYIVDDGWCGDKDNRMGIGKHCFGDYYVNFIYFESESPYDNNTRVPNSYPPLAMFIFKIFVLLTQTGLGSQFVLILYLGFLVFPIGFLALKLFGSNLGVKVLLICLTSLPMMSGLDRGNLVIITIPFLFLFGRNYLFKNPNASLFLVPAIMIKPQLALILLIYCNNLEIRIFLKSLLISISALFFGFLLFPTSFFENIKNWFLALLTFQDYNQEISHYPINLSGINLLGLPFKLLTSTTEGSVVDVNINARISQVVSVSIILIAIIVFLNVKTHHHRFERLVLAFLLPILAPSTSFSYYTVLFIPLFLIVISNKEKFSENLSSEKSVQFVLLLIGILCCLPIVLPLQFFTSFGSVGTEISVVWYFIGYMILGSYLLLVGVHLRRLIRRIFHDSKKVKN
jgi:hypothetical protein